MNGQSDQVENIGAELDRHRVNFLKSDLMLCFTFADLAATEIKMGDWEGVNKAISNAEKDYQTVSRFLSDPKHVSHLTADEIREFTAQLTTASRAAGRINSVIAHFKIPHFGMA